jgi:hypothetical protein
MTREVFVFSTFSLLTEEYQQAPSAIQAIRYVFPRGGFVRTGSGGFQTHWGMLIGTPPKQEMNQPPVSGMPTVSAIKACLISIICTSMMINQMMHGFWYK